MYYSGYMHIQRAKCFLKAIKQQLASNCSVERRLLFIQYCTQYNHELKGKYIKIIII